MESIFVYILCRLFDFLVMPQLKESSCSCVRMQEKLCKICFRVKSVVKGSIYGIQYNSREEKKYKFTGIIRAAHKAFKVFWLD